MGQKTSPVGLRLQINRTWDSRWFAEGADYGRLLLEDLQIRRSIIEKHHGRLWATLNDGPGATFSFSIPERFENLTCASDRGTAFASGAKDTQDAMRNS